MDPFTQRMLEKAEQRSRALGISNASKFPLAETRAVASANVAGDGFTTIVSSQKHSHAESHQMQKKVQLHSTANQPSVRESSTVLLEKTKLEATPVKPLRHYTAVNKENMDLGIEINITTDKPIGVQVEIQEQDDSDSESNDEVATQMHNAPMKPPLRDTSRNRLQRLGALYSNTADLSSPIHRTEEQFHAENDGEFASGHQKPKQRLFKLAALADTINQWEDDTVHHELHRPPNVVAPPKPELPSRQQSEGSTHPKKPMAPQPKPRTDLTDASAATTKQLKWDPKVISSLEAQGFQRRESSTLRHTYDYVKDSKDDNDADNKKSEPIKPVAPQKSSTVSQVAKTFTSIDEKKTDKPASKQTNIKSGLVFGRAAIFEHKANSNREVPAPRSQKDPCELSLKERMKLFETSNAKAILPKAPIATAPSLTQIRAEQAAPKQDEIKVITHSASSSSVAAQFVKPKADNKLREKVAALVANAQSSAESRIKDIDRQRQEDMQIIANRFSKQKELLSREPSATTEQESKPLLTSQQAKPVEYTKISRPMPPPPPPPNALILSSKRRSPGDVIDEETKRARKSNLAAANRLYPALSDLDSSDDNCCATVTASVTDDTQQDGEESYMEDESDMSVMMVQDDDDEQSQTEDSSAGMCNVSLGREVMQVVCNNEANQAQRNKKAVHYAEKDEYYACDGHDSSMTSSFASTAIDDYLDEALHDGDDESDESNTEETSRASRDSRCTTASNSFSFRKAPGQFVAEQRIDEDHEMEMIQSPMLHSGPPVKSELCVNQTNDNLVTLVHTVSFYRRQQNANSANSTPVRKISREQQILRSALDAGGAKHKLEYDSPQNSSDVTTNIVNDQRTVYFDDDGPRSDTEVDNGSLVQDKIKKLLDEVCKQQQVIGQASQALNLCAATIEFSGSTESVEGERYLLLATNRRQACLDEVQRLRIESSLRPVDAPKEKGILTIREITIPLRQEYVRKMATNTIIGHHLVCLLKYNEHVLATKTVPTMPGLLSVKFPDILQLNNVYADFRMTLEIYGMLAQRDELPHELKYHINLNKKGGIKTPKKKGSDNRLVMPPVQSPAGPNAVRTPQLVQYGFAIFSLREIQRTAWTLTQVLGVSPLEGVVHMKINCELSVSVTYKGFLTMFEDISGFGAWHRRWCYLNGSVISYWKYPDDEKKKAPMGSIDLNGCVTQKVTTAPRDVCARLNTMLLECERPAKDTDQKSLIIVPNGRKTIVRHLLSADTKEEREEWSAHLNKSLTLIRAWGSTQ